MKLTYFGLDRFLGIAELLLYDAVELVREAISLDEVVVHKFQVFYAIPFI
ncbi:MAG: hypothetical protein QMD09_09970 [Desulfatibacillaceae bacterium]|nr:hypothetical protein [Desulfatibacillaceae bacterium]